MNDYGDVPAVIETRLAHDVHRRTTTLLAGAAPDPGVPGEILAEVRDFLVAHLHHHHQSEDDVLWPMIARTAPEVAGPLAALGDEHDLLDAALDELEKAPVDDRAAFARAAATVRDVVHRHLQHEEPLLFPALREHVPAEEWAAFSRQVVLTSPPVGVHLLVGILDQVGTPQEVELVLSHLPEPARQMLPVMREQAQPALAALQAG